MPLVASLDSFPEWQRRDQEDAPARMRALREQPLEDPDILALAAPARILFDALFPALAADEYGVIIGDDNSGRLPTLVMRHVINAYRQRQGRPRLPVIFVQGLRHPDDQVIHCTRQVQVTTARLQLVRAPRNKRALLVTDFIASGGTVIQLVGAIAAAGYVADVAAVGAWESAGWYQQQLPEAPLDLGRAAGGRPLREWLDLRRRMRSRVYVAGTAEILCHRPSLHGMAPAKYSPQPVHRPMWPATAGARHDVRVVAARIGVDLGLGE